MNIVILRSAPFYGKLYKPVKLNLDRGKIFTSKTVYDKKDPFSSYCYKLKVFFVFRTPLFTLVDKEWLV